MDTYNKQGLCRANISSMPAPDLPRSGGLPMPGRVCHSLRLKTKIGDRIFDDTNVLILPLSCGPVELNPLRGNSGMGGYLRAFLRFDPPAIRRAVLLNFATALTEGAGLLMLLPLLSLAGAIGQGGQSTWTNTQLGQLFSSLGIKLTIETALFVFVALVALQSLLALHRDRVSHALYLRFADQLRKDLYAAISHARWSFLTGQHSGELAGVLTSEIQRIGAGTFFLLRFFTIAILALAYLAVALWLSTWLTLLALATGILLWVLLRGTDGAAKHGGMMLSQANRNLSVRMQDFLSAMKLVKIHGQESDCMERFNREIEQVLGHNIEFQRSNTRMQMIHRVGGALALAVVCYAALAWFALPAAHLLVMIAIFARMLPQIAELQSGRQHLLHMLPSYAAWRKLMDACEAQRDPVLSHGEPVRLTQGIVFEQVDFTHPESRHALRIESLKIPARQTTAITGVSGSGKTTLLDLLSGLLAPVSGAILIDGVPLPQVPGWRQSIAYIPQETHILNGTIRDNLLWGNAAPDDGEIDSALAQASLAGWVSRMPQGIDTEVGERGLRLSGGEKQRLALARALLRRPQLLILDEATSALDADNQRIVLDAIRALHLKMTVLIVTHRHEEFAGLVDGLVRVENGVAWAWQASGGAN
jgi:ATP-binding cassette subfamily C protein